MNITFYGVRGSIATPGATTVKYGGNTSCTHVQLNDGSHFVFDSGTGMRLLGQSLINDQNTINLLVTHNHWDHIQGFPFFDPIYDPQREIHVASQLVSGVSGLPVLNTVGGPFHPVEFDSLGANFRQHVLSPKAMEFVRGNALITTKPLNHPNGGCAYKLQADGLCVAYVTDNELFPPDDPITSYQEWVAFLKGVDVLIHDAQYTEEDMPCKHGWGHSLISQVLTLACDAGARAVVLYHHDPSRTDSQLDEILIGSEAMFKRLSKQPKIFCAAEGQTLSISKDSISTN